MMNGADDEPQHPTILIVDDDFDLREILVDVLEDEGFHARWARDGVDAMAELQMPPRVNLILLDLNMPKMDGRAFRAAQLADAQLAAIPVVVLSAAEGLGRSVDSLRAAASLTKPFILDTLLNILRQVLQRDQTCKGR